MLVQFCHNSELLQMSCFWLATVSYRSHTVAHSNHNAIQFRKIRSWLLLRGSPQYTLHSWLVGQQSSCLLA